MNHKTVNLRGGRDTEAKLSSAHLEGKGEFTFDVDGPHSYISTNVKVDALRDFAQWVLDVSAGDNPKNDEDKLAYEIPGEWMAEVLGLLGLLAMGVKQHEETMTLAAARARRLLGEHQSRVDERIEGLDNE